MIWNFEGLDTGAHFWYDNQHRMIVQVTTLNGQKDRKTLYAGGLEQGYRYDESYDVTGSAHDDWRPLYTRIHIAGPNGTVGCYTHKSSHSDDTGASTGRSLYLNDYQGNLHAVVEEPSGAVSAQLSFDAWRNRRDPVSWVRYGDPAAHTPEDANGHRLARGYTGHEMMDELGLVHMNGRLYDPLLGRMLSADLVVQTPENFQNYNRYSYVLNNPVSYADPSGYAFTIIAAFVMAKVGVNVVTVGVMFAAGFADALIRGASVKDAFRSGLIAAASAVVAHQIGNYFDNALYDEQFEWGKTALDPLGEMARASAHGLSQGGFSEIVGGDFGSGFPGGFTGSLAGSLMQTKNGHSIFGGEWTDKLMLRTVSAAIVGGTTAEIGGGKFANRAFSAAIVHLLNAETSGQDEEAQEEKPQLGDIKDVEVTAAPTLYGRPIPELIKDDFVLAAFGSPLTLSSNIPLASPFDRTFVVDASMWFFSANPTLPGSGDAINGFVTVALQNAKDYINIAMTRPTEMQIRVDYKVFQRRFLFFKGWKQESFTFPYRPGGNGLPTKQQYEKGINNAIENFPGG